MNGRTDLCFADGRPEQTRDVGAPAARVRIAGEFAFVSRDADGLRQATLTGGTRLETPEVALKPAARERAGVVTRADYANKGCVIDQPWAEAPLLKGRVYEIGGPGHWTSYTLADAKPGTADTTFKVDGSADFYLSRVREVDAEKRIVRCVLAMPHTTKENTTPCPGADKHWVASNESRTKFWRADYVGTSGGDEALFEFQLDGPVTKGDFGDTAGFYLWEYGVGDRVRMSTFAALRRLEPALFELSADGGLTVGLQARGLELSVNQDAWKPLQGRMANGLFEAAIPLDDLLEGRGRVYLRAQP